MTFDKYDSVISDMPDDKYLKYGYYQAVIKLAIKDPDITSEDFDKILMLLKKKLGI